MNAGPEDNMRFDDHIFFEHRIMVEKDRFRRHKRRAAFHSGMAQSFLQGSLSHGEIGAVIDPHHFFGVSFHGRDIQAPLPCCGNDVGQVLLTGGIVHADIIEQFKHSGRRIAMIPALTKLICLSSGVASFSSVMRCRVPLSITIRP